MDTNKHNLSGIHSIRGNENPDGFPVSYVLAKWLQRLEHDINKGSDAILLRIELNRFMKRRPFSKEDYEEIYYLAVSIAPHELQALYDTKLFTEEELEQFDRIVQENINFDSYMEKVIKDNPGKDGFEIMEILIKPEG